MSSLYRCILRRQRLRVKSSISKERRGMGANFKCGGPECMMKADYRARSQRRYVRQALTRGVDL
jgi:hypothetical protein